MMILGRLRLVQLLRIGCSNYVLLELSCSLRTSSEARFDLNGVIADRMMLSHCFTRPAALLLLVRTSRNGAVRVLLLDQLRALRLRHLRDGLLTILRVVNVHLRR